MSINKFRKGFVFGIIVLFIGTSIVPTTGSMISKENNVRFLNLSGNTLYVGGNGPGNYSTIQAAINDANPGDTVFVYNGTYDETILVNKSIDLIGEDRDITIIDGGASGDVVSIVVDWVNISGFTIQHASNKGITIVSSSFVTVSDCNILNNDLGVFFQSSDDNQLVGCTIWENPNCIYLDASLRNNISDNTVLANRSNNWDAIELRSSSNHNTLSGNIIQDSRYGVYVHASSNNIISGNVISGNWEGIRFFYSAIGNLIFNNFFENTNNARDSYDNIWNVTKIEEVNIIGGRYLGGNFWHDYTGIDTDGDGLGDTQLPYNSNGNIDPGGDWLPLVNVPPNEPSNPNPANNSIDIEIDADLSWDGGDPDPGNLVFYDVYFGTSSPPPKVSSNQTETTYDPGVLEYTTMYYWMIVSWDNHGAFSSGPIWSFTTAEEPNQPPGAPEINGQTSGKTGEEYFYTFVAVDPNGDDIFYEIDWGDGHVNDWDGPYESNEMITSGHTWEEQGDYTIRARAKDVHDAVGDWGYLEISMPSNLLQSNSLLQCFLERFLNMFPILRQLLGL